MFLKSAPDCIASSNGAIEGDIDDVVLATPWQDCAGFMTYGPGSTYGEDGVAAASSYYFVTILGLVVFLAAMVYWIYSENRRLDRWVKASEQTDG